jgi:hypothetical protein
VYDIIFSDASMKSLRWFAVAGVAAAITYRNRAFMERMDLVREVVLVVFAYFAYFGVRGMTEGSADRALDNAGRVETFERWLHLDWEPAWQRLIVDHHALVSLANWIYIWGHWPVIIVTAVWLFLRRPRTYYLFRNAFLISGAIGLIIFATFPVAPPRLTDLNVIDTVTEYSRSYRVLQPPRFVNQYAAMPSLHFGWNLLVGIALASIARSWWLKAAALMIPAAMFLAVVLTANHYIIDAVAGASLSLAALGAAYWWSRVHPYREPRAVQRQEIGARASGRHEALQG